ncbi:hypothetical protein DWF00_27435 [Bosea caraganae]|uniref:Uncharacterized protein n=1 Tax=Bosea caraganae TaxID=2763117 RepID=A0A370KXM1_9HYPH|nr:hypothetical protein [Bosea caraganae]RDJ19744.1 hypothetical protein DWE98_28290 [Bosea caraganae]RDJ21374.1 hypothetical protein DWF00_27435 [Bosea caraganae]
MGYDIHITRKLHWSDDGPIITLDEWLAYVARDPEMRLDGFAETIVGGGAVLRIESRGLSVWRAYSHNGINGDMAWFDWSVSGSIIVKNPDMEILGKMWRIAQALSAKVEGDEGEIYDASGAVIDAPPHFSRNLGRKRPWWKFW